MLLTHSAVFVLRAIAYIGALVPHFQDPCPVVQSGESIAFCRLDPKPLRTTHMSPPAYPVVLRQAGVGGTVQVRFVLDSTGRVQRRTIEILSSTQPNFERALVNALDSGQFEPPSYHGIAADARIQLEAHFVAASVDSGPVRAVWSEDRTPVGFSWRIGWELIPRTLPAPMLAAAERDSVVRAVVLAMPLPQATESKRALCIELPDTWRSKALDMATLLELRRQRPNTVRREQCPPTYEAWIRAPGAKTRPPGALDPDFVTMGEVTAWTPDVVRVPVRTGRGVSGWFFDCDATRDPLSRRGWTVICHKRWRWVS
jgi:TonB family protein